MMSNKRNVDELLDDASSTARKQVKFDEKVKQHTLDSDEEEENDDRYNVLDENDIEGEEDGVVRQDGETPLTAFNMQEEMEDGHFDKDGHFIWNNEKEIRDNWLDNIDWHKVKDKDLTKDSYKLDEDKGLGDESDSDTEVIPFNEIESYRKVITYMKPKETINKALRRLGGDTVKLSSVERLKRKKAGTLTSNKEVTELTELANLILTESGNMDVYQETYEQINQKLQNHDKKNKSKAKIVEAELDMYADTFQVSETKLLKEVENESDEKKDELKWEFKWTQTGENIDGPHTTSQMQEWNTNGHFKTGVWVRKCGAADTNFYSSNRIDFELYL